MIARFRLIAPSSALKNWYSPPFRHQPGPWTPRFPTAKSATVPVFQRSVSVALCSLLCSVLLLSGCAKSAATTGNQASPPAPEVGVTTVIQKDVPAYGDWVATLDGYVNANIQPQVSGYLIKQDYGRGRWFTRTTSCLRSIPRPFQAALDQAKGQVAQAQGQLAQAEGQLAQARTQLVLASINVKRDTPLAQARAIAQSQLDNDTQAQAQAEALVKTDEGAIQASKAAIQAAEATVEQAQLNLGFTKVRSLIDGIAGIASIQIGNLVGPTATLTTVSHSIRSRRYFPISEQEYMAARRARSRRAAAEIC